jgi:flagellar protein FlaI
MYVEALSTLIRSLQGDIPEKEINKIDKIKIARLIERIYSKNFDITLKIRYNIAKKIFKNNNIALYITLRSINLDKLYWILLNDDIEDIVLIPGKYIYITSRSGKRPINLMADEEVVDAFLRIARSKGIRLLKSNPSFRYGLALGPYRLRVSVDLPPVVPSPQIYVRVHRGVATLERLKSSGFMDDEQEAMIRRLIDEQRDLVISGVPGSGKTTLLQAIDLAIPGWMQRVYIDESDEFIDIPNYNQIKINNVNKVKEIFSSMNRNIDLFILSELQYPDHFEAAKIARGMGLWTLATLHARDIRLAVERLKGAGIDMEGLAIIQLEKKYEKGIKRQIKDIYVK